MSITHTPALPAPKANCPNHREHFACKKPVIAKQGDSSTEEETKTEQAQLSEVNEQEALPSMDDVTFDVDDCVPFCTAKFRRSVVNIAGQISAARIQVLEEATDHAKEHLLNAAFGYGAAEGREAKNSRHAAQKGMVTSVTDQAQSLLDESSSSSSALEGAADAAGVAFFAAAIHTLSVRSDHNDIDTDSGGIHLAIDGDHLRDKAVNAACNGVAHTGTIDFIGAAKEGWGSDDAGKTASEKSKSAMVGKAVGLGVGYGADKVTSAVTALSHTAAGHAAGHVAQAAISHVGIAAPVTHAVQEAVIQGTGKVLEATAHGASAVVHATTGAVSGAVGAAATAAGHTAIGHAVGATAAVLAHTAAGHALVVTGAVISPVAVPILVVGAGTAAIVMGAHQVKRFIDFIQKDKKEEVKAEADIAEEAKTEMNKAKEENVFFKPGMG